MIKFREKNFSIIDSPILQSVLKGAARGGLIGGGASMIFPRQTNSMLPNGGKDLSNPQKNLAVFAGGAIIGAALGLVSGLIKKTNTSINRSNTVDNRLMQSVVEALKKSGFKEDKDFTRDPKTANDLKTKVCIVITRVSNDLKLLVNTVNDPKLQNIANGMIKNIPNSSVVNKKMSDKFNDISITSISDSSADCGLITGISEYFIHHGYPVYLVEVG